MTTDLTGGGWCIHGVPYGPNWSCGQCGSAIPTTYAVSPSPVRDWSELNRKLNRIIELLEMIARVRR